MRLCTIVFAVAALADMSGAQPTNIAPVQARSMVVRIHSTWSVRDPENGAGVIIAIEPNAVIVATAAHVVSFETQTDSIPYTKADSVWVAFYRAESEGDSVLAAVQFIDVKRDVAALRIPLTGTHSAELGALTLDWLGDPRAMRIGDVVYPMGCPHDECWQVLPGDGLLSNQPGEIRFQSMSVGPGSSGGALFNGRWEVVGIVLQHRPPLASAIPIRNVVALLDSARIAVQLRAPTVPRAGYHISVEATFLAPVSTPSVADSLSIDAAQPSGRITFTTRGRSALTWRVTGLRLAPYNTTVSGLLGGAGFTFRYQRLMVQPFVELGMGRVEARYDRGGYHVSSSSGNPVYVPLWTLERRDGIGVGGGVGVEYVVIPHVSIAATFAKWSFGLTPNAPAFPSFFAGGGLRWSR